MLFFLLSQLCQHIRGSSAVLVKLQKSPWIQTLTARAVVNPTSQSTILTKFLLLSSVLRPQFNFCGSFALAVFIWTANKEILEFLLYLLWSPWSQHWIYQRHWTCPRGNPSFHLGGLVTAPAASGSPSDGGWDGVEPALAAGIFRYGTFRVSLAERLLCAGNAQENVFSRKFYTIIMVCCNYILHIQQPNNNKNIPDLYSLFVK